MPFDSSGNFSLVNGYRAVTGQTITASQHNPPLEDIAQALSSTILRSGAAPMSANLPMAGFKVTGLGEGTNGTDSVTVGQVGTLAAGAAASAPAKTTPVDADTIPLADSASSNALRKLTWARVKAVLSDLFAVKARAITGAGLATGGGDLSADRTITVTAATQAQAEAGTANDVALTPLRGRQAVGPAVAALGVGSVGTYAMMRKMSGGAAGPGDTEAGSNLRYASADSTTGEGAATGTWECMGRSDSGGGTGSTTLWLRIS